MATPSFKDEMRNEIPYASTHQQPNTEFIEMPSSKFGVEMG